MNHFKYSKSSHNHFGFIDVSMCLSCTIAPILHSYAHIMFYYCCLRASVPEAPFFKSPFHSTMAWCHRKKLAKRKGDAPFILFSNGKKEKRLIWRHRTVIFMGESTFQSIAHQRFLHVFQSPFFFFLLNFTFSSRCSSTANIPWCCRAQWTILWSFVCKWSRIWPCKPLVKPHRVKPHVSVNIREDKNRGRAVRESAWGKSNCTEHKGAGFTADGATENTEYVNIWEQIILSLEITGFKYDASIIAIQWLVRCDTIL